LALHAPLRDQTVLHCQGVGERQRREKRDGLDTNVGRAGAIDAAHALREPGGLQGRS